MTFSRKILTAALMAGLALAGASGADAAARKSKAKGKLTAAQKAALMPKAKAMCMARKVRGSGALIRVEITDEGKLWCWIR